jgi:hypothetical protein
MTSETQERGAGLKCVHHWLIEAAIGTVSSGHCTRCGVSRSFANSQDSVMWERTNTLRASVQSGVRRSKPSEIMLSDESAEEL